MDRGRASSSSHSQQWSRHASRSCGSRKSTRLLNPVSGSSESGWLSIPLISCGHATSVRVADEGASMNERSPGSRGSRFSGAVISSAPPIEGFRTSAPSNVRTQRGGDRCLGPDARSRDRPGCSPCWSSLRQWAHAAARRPAHLRRARLQSPRVKLHRRQPARAHRSIDPRPCRSWPMSRSTRRTRRGPASSRGQARMHSPSRHGRHRSAAPRAGKRESSARACS